MPTRTKMAADRASPAPGAHVLAQMLDPNPAVMMHGCPFGPGSLPRNLHPNTSFKGFVRKGPIGKPPGCPQNKVRALIAMPPVAGDYRGRWSRPKSRLLGFTVGEIVASRVSKIFPREADTARVSLNLAYRVVMVELPP